VTEEEIASKILRDAHAAAEAVIRKAERASEDIIHQQREQALRDAEKTTGPIFARAKEEAEAARRQVITEARSKANWTILSEKRRLIEDALAMAEKKLVEDLWSDPATYVRLLSHLAREAGVALGGGDLELLLNQHDVHLRLDLDAIAAEIEKQTGVKTTLHLSGTRINSIGGLVMQADEGRRTVHNTFEGIVERRRRDLEIKASRLLFADGAVP